MKMIEYLYIGMLLLSSVLIAFAFRQYNISQKLMADETKTKAKLADLIEVRDDDGYRYKPVFEYRDRDNNLITFKSDISSSPAPYSMGDNVNIVYDKNNDDRKVISFWELYK